MNMIRAAWNGLLAMAFASGAAGADRFWDTGTASGYQPGDGTWSLEPADAFWTPDGITLGGWVNGDTAKFMAVNGASSVLLPAAGVQAAALEVRGSRYSLAITNGGTLTVAGNFIVGYSTAASSNNTLAVTGGEGVTSKVTSSGTCWIGYTGKGNSLLIDGLDVPGSAVFDGTLSLGYTGAGSMSNSVIVRRGGRLHTSGNLLIGRSSPFQQLTVSQGGILEADVVYVGNQAGGNSNTFLVTDTGTVVDAVATLVVGASRIGNRLVVADGAVMTNMTTLRLSDVGGFDSGMIVTNGGKVYPRADFPIGYNGASSCFARVMGNGSILDLGGKNLIVGTASGWSNALEITSGGRVENVNWLHVPLNNRLVLSGGSLVAGRVAYTGETALAVGDGSQAFTLTLTNRGASAFSSGLRIKANAAFQGVGRLDCGGSGLEVEAGGQFDPGFNGIGCVTNIGPVAFHAGSGIGFHLASALPAGTGSDLLSIESGTASLGGALKPALLGDFVPSPSDRFVVLTNISAGGVSGSFDNVGNGQAVTVYGEDGVTKAGLLTVEIGPQGVALSQFRAYKGGGSILVIH